MRQNQLSLSRVISIIKGKSSKLIKEEFPELLETYRHGHLWSGGYFVRTVGLLKDEGFENYVSELKDKEENLES